jgi:hypothetical protein
MVTDGGHEKLGCRLGAREWRLAAGGQGLGIRG